MDTADRPVLRSRAWIVAAAVLATVLLVLATVGVDQVPFAIAASVTAFLLSCAVVAWAFVRSARQWRAHEDELTAWAAERAAAAERLRIARDLHDVVGHQLTALSVNLQVASRTATGPAKDDLEVCRAVASDLLRDVREVVSQLRETPSAGPEFAEELRTIGHSVPSPVVDVDVADDLPPLGAAEADVVRRCIQEIVTNAVRHSGATSVWIAVEELDGVVSVTARDDGQGSGGDGADVVMGHGLTGMVERFEALGGSVAWTARPGQGFTLQASVPVGRVAAT